MRKEGLEGFVTAIGHFDSVRCKVERDVRGCVE